MRTVSLVAVFLLPTLSCNGVVSLSAQSGGVTAYERSSDVIYGRKDGVALTLEVLAPSEPNGVGVLWAVSSSGRSSREQTFAPSFEARVAPLLARGYTIFAVVHGSAPRYQLTDHLADVRRAVRFVRFHAERFSIDGDALAIAGSSSGGFIALIIALDGRDGDQSAADPVDRASSRVQAAGAFFPPTDLSNYGGSGEHVIDYLQRRFGAADPSFEFYTEDSPSGTRTRVTDSATVARLLHDLSPVSHASAGDPPVLLIHGDADPAVPYQQSLALLDRLEQAGVAARLITRQGAGHAWPGWEQDAALIAEWFHVHLPRSRRAQQLRH